MKSVRLRPPPAIKRLREALSYDPLNGEFTWREGRGRSVGAPAGTLLHSSGHIVIELDGIKYLAHRLAWLLTYDEWPECLLDHIDRQPANNRIVNLRKASFSENAANSRLRIDNTSGSRGVSWHRQRGKWRAEMQVRGVRVHLGLFSTLSEAERTYRKAQIDAFGEFANV
jgi:hypothetical protein